MDQKQFKAYTKSKNVESHLNIFTRCKSNKIISDTKIKINSTKKAFKDAKKKDETGESTAVVYNKIMLEKLCQRPTGLTEVRRDGKDNDAIVRVIQLEFKRCEEKGMSGEELCKHMQTFASACWVCCFLVIIIHK